MHWFCILGTIFFIAIAIWGYEEIHYDFSCHDNDDMCLAVQKRPIRLVKGLDEDGDLFYFIQFQTPFTMRWKNWLIGIGIDYYVTESFSTEEKALKKIKEIKNTGNRNKTKIISKTLIYN